MRPCLLVNIYPIFSSLVTIKKGEGATLLEGLTGHVVQLGAIRQETYPDAFNGLFWSYGLGSLDVLQPTQLVLDCGIEGSQAVELHGLTL